MSKYLKVLVILLSMLALSACRGQLVEVPPAYVAKVMGSNGYLEGTHTTSKFRLAPCLNYCDKLVLLRVADTPKNETMQLLMPKDKLNMTFDLRLTLAVNPTKYEELFNKVAPVLLEDGNTAIHWETAYDTYAKQIIRTEAREYLTGFTIAEVMSSRETINNQLAERLAKSIGEQTPFIVRYAGLAEIDYPKIIVEAQENAAERRERIQQEEAQLQISKVQLERALQEAQLQRRVDVEKAEAEAEVNRILASTVTPAYVRYRELNNQEYLAKTTGNKTVFVPTDMLRGVAAQVKLGQE